MVTASLLIDPTAAYAPFPRWCGRTVGPYRPLARWVVLTVIWHRGGVPRRLALIAEAGPARMTLITTSTSTVAIVLGALVLNEPLTMGLAIGFPLVIIGSVLGTWRSTPPPAEAAARCRQPQI